LEEALETDQEVNERAAAEAAKDLYTDYGDGEGEDKLAVNFEEEE